MTVTNQGSERHGKSNVKATQPHAESQVAAIEGSNAGKRWRWLLDVAYVVASVVISASSRSLRAFNSLRLLGTSVALAAAAAAAAGL
jgi:hypothetical protein|eukprot:COSAG06_NODE_1718_length_8594_cov_8.860506_2_plen_87_part_00